MKIITKKKEKKILKKECWNLDYQLVKWLNEHLKVYLEDASKMVDLEFHMVKIKNKNYKMGDAIKRLIEITEFMANENSYYEWNDVEKLEDYKNEMYDILKAIHFYLWW